MPAKIKVTASMDRMGNILVRPVNIRYARAFANHVKELSGHHGSPDLDAFFQDGGSASEFLSRDVPRRHRKDLENGYSVTWKEDPWVVGHWYGWDAHTLAEDDGEPTVSLRRREYGESIYSPYRPPEPDNMGRDPENPRSGKWALRMLRARKSRLAPVKNNFVKNKKG
jgi:hypothetical protein